MPKRAVRIAGILLAALCGVASAQDAPVIKVKIEHPFMVMDSTLPAGEYTLAYELGPNSFTITGSGPDAPEAFVAVETRIAGPNAEVNIPEPRLVFDVFGDRYVLSEIWIPQQAGYLVSSEQKNHDHSITLAHRS